MIDDNVLLDTTNPLHFLIHFCVLGDINTGWWYKRAKKLCTSPHDVLLPLLKVIDGSNIDKNGPNSVEPVMLTLGIFKRSTCTLAKAWRTVGSMENIAHKSKEDAHSNK